MKDVKKLYANSTGQTRPSNSTVKTYSHSRQLNQNKAPARAATTWNVISVTGRADTSSSEKAYLNKSFTPKVIELATSVSDEFDNIINIRKIS